MLRLLTDFNDIRDGHAGGLVEDVTGGEIAQGDRVLLYDLDSEVLGRVTDISENGVVTALIVWDTWGPAGRYHDLGDRGWWIVLPSPHAVIDAPPVIRTTDYLRELVVA